MVVFDLHKSQDGQDGFFSYAMIILPFCSSSCYLFDSWYHYQHGPYEHTFEGLL
jgi:hypothetical protein